MTTPYSAMTCPTRSIGSPRAPSIRIRTGITKPTGNQRNALSSARRVAGFIVTGKRYAMTCPANRWLEVVLLVSETTRGFANQEHNL